MSSVYVVYYAQMPEAGIVFSFYSTSPLPSNTDERGSCFQHILAILSKTEHQVILIAHLLVLKQRGRQPEVFLSWCRRWSLREPSSVDAVNNQRLGVIGQFWR